MDSDFFYTQQRQNPDYDIDPQIELKKLEKEYPTIVLPTSYPTLAEVECQARALSKSVFHSWNILNHVVCGRNEAIWRRWRKKSERQRKSVILGADPDIPPNHQPDQRIIMRLLERGYCQCCSKAKPTFCDAVQARNEAAFKCPHINLEDLVKGKNLPLFLDCRGRNLPHAFAHADLISCAVGRHSTNIPTSYLHGYTMYLTGQTTEESYGKIVYWKDEAVEFGSVGQTLQFQPGHGLLVLEIQNRILDFLIKCCLGIFRDIPKDELLNLELAAPLEDSQALATTQEISRVQLSTMIAEAPYRLPTILDTVPLLALVEARRNAAEDHIWDMREDPGYFAATLTEHHEHRPELLRDLDGKPNPILNDDRTWDRILSTAVGNAYEDFYHWNRLHRKIRQLASRFGRHPEVLSPHQRLPPNLEYSLMWVYRTLDDLCCIVVRRFIVAVSCSHPKCARFARCPHTSDTTTEAEIFIKGKFEPLLVLVRHLSRHENQSMEEIRGIVDDIQYYLDHDPAQKNVFSSFVQKLFSDLALITQISHQIDVFYPWAPFFIHEAYEYVHEPRVSKTHVDTVIEVLRIPKVFDCNSLLNLRHKKFYYPIGKAYDAAQVAAMQKAEANLDEVWVKLEIHFASHHPRTLVHVFKSYYTSNQRGLRRTPAYVSSDEPGIKSRPKCLGASLNSNISFRSINAASEEPLKFTPQIKKPRIKTRGTPAPSDEAEQGQRKEAVEGENPDMPKKSDKEQLGIDLGKRGRKVLATLFHLDNKRNQCGEIPWKDFLQVMTALKFTAEKLYGSVWQFTPTTGSVKRGIHVHEPHPSNKIHFNMARMIGRRLIRTYGWTEDMFVVG